MDIEQALIKIHDLISPLTTDWLLIGTMSLYLQGYDVAPHDIDILCTAPVAKKIAGALAEYHITPTGPVSRDKFRSEFNRYEIDGIHVEVMGGLEVNARSEWTKLLDIISQTEQVSVRQKSFQVPSKPDQLKIYQLFGREKDAAVIGILSE